jgi:hypothetical protein
MWSMIAGAMALLCQFRRHAGRARLAGLVVAAAFSHWLLDALVHRPEMPVAGAASARVGLALGVEAALVVAGTALFLRGSGLGRARSSAIGALSAVILVFTVVGMTVAPPPPSATATAMAASSWVTLAVVCLLFAWLGKPLESPATPAT